MLNDLVGILKTDPSKVTRIGIYRVCFDKKFKIGDGCQGTKVYVGLSDDGYEVAIKRLKLEKCGKMGENAKKILNSEAVKNEKYIVNYRFHKEVDSKTTYLVFDLHEENLEDYVKNKERTIDKLIEEAPHIIRQILYGVRALHCEEPVILHRDLKPQNILVNVEGKMLLCDFGISKILPRPKTTLWSEERGTDGWMAAESLLDSDEDDDDGDDDDDKKTLVRYKKQSDIQVLGMVSYYILTKGKHPYGKRRSRSHNISKGKFDLKHLSDPSAKDLITWMLQHEPDQRPSVDQCLKHPYLKTPEENFEFLSAVGNETEIKDNIASSTVVRELKNVHGFNNWRSKIEPCVINHMESYRRYKNDATDLFRFIRNMAEHWHHDAPSANVVSTVGCPREYFESKFPTLAGEVYGIIRRHSTWTSKETLKKYF